MEPVAQSNLVAEEVIKLCSIPRDIFVQGYATVQTHINVFTQVDSSPQ